MNERRRGNLLEADADALVNTVNCVGVMGKGIALQFKQAYPENFRRYEQACRAHEVQPGRMLTVRIDRQSGPRFIINFPTKRNWKQKSRLVDIAAGLPALIAEVRALGIRSIAVPPLGCGNGGLNWADVVPLIEKAFAEVPDVHVILYEPDGAPVAAAMPVATAVPNMTLARALLLKLLDLYWMADHRITKLEIQKLAYFLQIAGEPLRLQYVKHRYGPYAENLNHVLQRLEGHYIRGYGDRSNSSEIYLMPGATAIADVALADSQYARGRLDRVSRLIEGFETPHGMELLATVHWVAHEDMLAAVDPEQAILCVHAWSVRKRENFKPEHIRKAWDRLHDQGWLPAPAA